MIALDTSAVIAIALNEPEEDSYSREIAFRGAIIGTPTLFECRMVLTSKLARLVDEFLRDFVEQETVHPVDFTMEMYRLAADALVRFGKGRGHPAQLNFGDCLAYAVAKQRNAPLLYKGDDFARTDIRSAQR